MHVTVCICTYQRPAMLRHLLARLQALRTEGRFTLSIAVADNDAARSAEPVVAEAAATSAVPIRYAHEPRQNIALARNCVLGVAEGEFIAFIDDDEFPEPDWLLQGLGACERLGVSGVLGPVRPHFEHTPPRWLVHGRFCERPEHPTGTMLPWRETRTGNVVMRRAAAMALEGPFRPQFGSGGEDQDFFKRLIERGHRFAWCNEAVVHETVPAERCTRRYMLHRAWLRGQNERSLVSLRGIAKSLLAVPIYLAVLPLLGLTSQAAFMRYAIRLCDHAGKLLGLVGFRPLQRPSTQPLVQ